MKIQVLGVCSRLTKDNCHIEPQQCCYCPCKWCVWRRNSNFVGKSHKAVRRVSLVAIELVTGENEEFAHLFFPWAVHEHWMQPGCFPACLSGFKIDCIFQVFAGSSFVQQRRNFLLPGAERMWEREVQGIFCSTTTGISDITSQTLRHALTGEQGSLSFVPSQLFPPKKKLLF